MKLVNDSFDLLTTVSHELVNGLFDLLMNSNNINFVIIMSVMSW